MRAFGHSGDGVIERIQRELPGVDVQLLHAGARYTIEVARVALKEEQS